MDDHEIRAFELQMELNAAKRAFPRSEAREHDLIKAIAYHKSLSRTWVPLGQAGRIYNNRVGSGLPLVYTKAIPEVKLNKRGGGRPGKPIRCPELKKTFPSISKAADAIGGQPSGISKVLNGRMRTYMGYTFKYSEKRK